MSTMISKQLGLRLYVALSTPNSERAVENLRSALDGIGERGRALPLEVVDVFTHPRRAINDGVIVTPTLIGLRDEARLVMIGDLTDKPKLLSLLDEMIASLETAWSSTMRKDSGLLAY